MDPLATSHFSNRDLLRDFDARVARNHTELATLLTRIAEIDERRLYLEEGYPSMKVFLVQRMRLPTENAAYKRLTAARLARKYPGILVALYDGRLHLRGVLTLAPHLTPAIADELVAAALDKTCFELEVMLAQRFPRPDMPERLDAIAALAAPLADSLAPGRVETTVRDWLAHGQAESRPAGPAHQLVSERVEAPRARMTPLAPQKFGFQFTGDQETRDSYERVRNLLSHEIPTGEMALVFKCALRIAEAELMKRRFAATDRPGPARGGADPRHIPAVVKRAVAERDRERCSFVSDAGKRCKARRFLELDHEIPVARGGEATAENIRLLCRAHNQHAAERAFGAEFMDQKKREAGRRV
jgi:hypothetical protein